MRSTKGGRSQMKYTIMRAQQIKCCCEISCTPMGLSEWVKSTGKCAVIVIIIITRIKITIIIRVVISRRTGSEYERAQKMAQWLQFPLAAILLHECCADAPRRLVAAPRVHARAYALRQARERTHRCSLVVFLLRPLVPFASAPSRHRQGMVAENQTTVEADSRLLTAKPMETRLCKPVAIPCCI